MRLLSLSLALAMCSFPSAALATCLPSFEAGSREVVLRASDSMDDVELVERFEVSLRNDGDSECRLRLRVEQNPTSSDASFPDYSLAGPGGTVRISANSLIKHVGGLVILPPGSQQPVRFTVTLPVGWGMPAGSFLQRLRFALAEDGDGSDLDTAEVSLRLTIPSTARIRFAGALGGGGDTRVDLGVLSTRVPTVSRPFAVRVLSTSAYQVQFTSEHGGKLRRLDGSETIAYQLYAGGRRLNLAAGDKIIASQHTGATGDVHRIQVRVAPDPTWHAGNYSDRVTVTVTTI